MFKFYVSHLKNVMTSIDYIDLRRIQKEYRCFLIHLEMEKTYKRLQLIRLLKQGVSNDSNESTP